MIICSCNAISESSVRASIRSEKSPRTPGQVYRCLGCSPNCGRCYATVRAIIEEALGQASLQNSGSEGTLRRFKDEWSAGDVPVAQNEEAGTCAKAGGCDGCAAAPHEDAA